MAIKHPLVLAAFAGLLSVVVALLFVDMGIAWSRRTPIASDSTSYAEIASRVLDGAVPYRDVTIEHLPVMLIPILFVGVISLMLSIPYTILWPLVAVGGVVATIAVAGRVDLVEGYQRRFLIAIVPMLPLIVFRLEIYVVFTAVVAIAAFGASRYRSGAAWTLLGVLAKGWPVTLFAVPWKKGHRSLTVGAVGIATLVLLSVAATPAFRRGRAFEGIHSETIVGNLILLWRHAAGLAPGIVNAAGATYTRAPAGSVLLNALVALPILGVALWLLQRATLTVRLVSIAGLMTAGIILASPLFSPQFIFWLAPFVVVASKRTRVAYIVVGTLSLIVVAFWSPTELWWVLEVLTRNVAFIVLVALWAVDLSTSRDGPVPITSRSIEHLA